METIIVTESNVKLFTKRQHVMKTPEIGSLLTVVKKEVPYTNKVKFFAIVTDFTPTMNTQRVIAHGDYADAEKYGWKEMAELAKEIVEKKDIKNWYAFNTWTIETKDLQRLLKQKKNVSV